MIRIRISGAGATYDMLTHIESLNTSRRTVRYSVGWTHTYADVAAFSALPPDAWTAALRQDATVQPETGVAELTGLNTRQRWPANQRLIVRRTRPAARHRANLTALEPAPRLRAATLAPHINRIPRLPRAPH